MDTIAFNPEQTLYTKEEINTLPTLIYEGEIALVRTATELNNILPELRKAKILGFDTETRPLFAKGTPYPPSLIQLATDQKVYLIQLKNLKFDQDIADILASEDIIKTGVAIQDDLNALMKIFPFQPSNIVDIAHLAKKKGLQAQGLRTITANLLGYRISKGAQCSNWSVETLTHAQIKYAATDAWLGLIIYNILIDVVDSPSYLIEMEKKKKRFKKKRYPRKNDRIAETNKIIF